MKCGTKQGFVGAAGALALMYSYATAGNWHVGSSLLCQDCHVEHASESGQQTPGGPFTSLLLKNTVDELCLSCHDGTDATAPDILQPIDMYQTTSSKESGGGFVVSPGFDHVSGHSIGLAFAVPLNSQGKVMTLSCASCHAYHGNDNYRNLANDPNGTGDSLVVREGIEVMTLVRPSNPPTSEGSTIAYARNNVAYVSQYTRWCTSCHDQLRTNVSGVSPAHFSSHPTDVAINEYGSATHTDQPHWTVGSGDGFTASGGIQRIPFLNSQGTDFTSASTVSASNKVFCLTCHKAHGSTNKRAILWPFVEGGTNYLDGCQQCHNK